MRSVRPPSGALLMGVMLAAACSAKKPPVASTPAAAPPELLEGRTAARVLSSPPPPITSETAEVTIVPAYAGGANELPRYPSEALLAPCGSGLVPVRVHIGAEGRVLDQTPIPDRPMPTDACHVAFREAVRKAVGRWTFFPAMRRTCRQVPDAAPDCSEVPVRIFVDIEFTFEVVQGKGIVRSH
jgi:outer membrane biosynthesis protein TonB